jgi:FkbM family methyltransferase
MGEAESALHETLKSLLIRVTPPRALQFLKRHYYRRMLERQTDSNQPEFVIIRELVHAGDSVIDVGANIGLFTSYLSRLIGSRGVVHSVEPIPVTYDILSSSVNGLGLPNVRLWNFAASDHDGTALMEIPHYRGLSRENFYQARIVSDAKDLAPRTYTVPLRALGALPELAKRRHAFIKIDVEGHELAVVKGAMSLISTSKPSMLIEVSGNMEDAGSPAAELSGLLVDQGYRSYWLDDGRLRTWRAGVRSVNYFFLRPEHLNRLTMFVKPSGT